MNLIKKASEQLNQIIIDAINKGIANGELKEGTLNPFNIEIPADKSHGDFATNAAMTNVKVFGLPPRKIAEIILANANCEGSYIADLSIAGPGFINAKISPKWFGDVLCAVQDEKQDYGRTTDAPKQKIMVEFVSANPTGPMHIGNARGGAIGDCLASVLDWAGNDVTREFYVNDAGNQIEKFAVSLEARYLQIYKGDEIEFPEDAYHGEDIKVHAKNFADINGDKYVDASSDERKKALVEFALPKNIENLKTDLEKYRIYYDVWFKESQLHQQGKVKEVIDILTKNGHTYEKDGAIWYKSTDSRKKYDAKAEEKDEVLVRANGIPTYFAADIAYHYNKFDDRKFDKVINIWGADHHGHVARLKGAMDDVGLDGEKLDIVLMQLVRLMRNGETVRVSKRTGKSLTLVDLLDEVPIDAARFFFNLRESNSHLDFDLGLAVEQSSQNPVYYVQYAHARICSIISNLSKEKYNLKPANEVDLSLLTAPEEIELIRHIALLPSEILNAAKAYDPAKITRYAIDLATLFHKFYNTCRVKGESEDILYARLLLCDCVRIVLKNVLSMLKIDAPELM